MQAVVGPPSRVYPRECGGTPAADLYIAGKRGLSPRVRGNPRDEDVADLLLGSIPASAGEPRSGSCGGFRSGVYPRECGGTLERCVQFFSAGGLSRECGGTEVTLWERSTQEGLSPRVRGNQRRRGEDGVGFGSIPASAGEPRCCDIRANWPGVYPRECGGTCEATERIEAGWGLSPRVRGNRRIALRLRAGFGSIPASAGEPGLAGTTRPPRRVYPRECGGTEEALEDFPQGTGLSPRVRGNPRRPSQSAPTPGSIPASAGEPTAASMSSLMLGVYPRECGGTRGRRATCPPPRGLSPRVRGNPPSPAPIRAAARSIPASAGEPPARRRSRRRGGVYPRECGGTTVIWDDCQSVVGLSPRVRGNRRHGGPDVDVHGSIPASAGEPPAGSAAGRGI